jgi:hypothetical protein
MDPKTLLQYINQLVAIRAQLELRIVELEAKILDQSTPSPTS